MSDKASSDCNQDNQQPSPETVSYRDAGVDIDAGNSLVERIKPLVASTMRPEVMAGIGGFGALVGIDLQRYREPVLVSGTDGVGTKLLLARQLQKHDSIGIDLVAMCVNDILVQGAEPLFFLDYFACGQLSVDQAADVVSGIAAGCRQAGCALVGGETAEMPGMYGAGDYDLAGFVVGIADKAKIIDGTQVRAGHHIIGVASSGPHSNGYSLIRHLLETRQASLDQRLQDIAGLPASGKHANGECLEDLSHTLGEALLAPTRIYAQLIHALLDEHPIDAMSHITGGGLLENINRSIPAGLVVQLNPESWPRPAVFRWLQGEYQDAAPRIDATEMLRTFNCGVGFVLVVAAEHSQAVLEDLAQRGEKAWHIGQVLNAADASDAAAVVLG